MDSDIAKINSQIEEIHKNTELQSELYKALQSRVGKFQSILIKYWILVAIICIFLYCIFGLPLITGILKMGIRDMIPVYTAYTTIIVLLVIKQLL
jgi:tetrahydromethanopterin S-methyltransferase subunit G